MWDFALGFQRIAPFGRKAPLWPQLPPKSNRAGRALFEVFAPLPRISHDGVYLQPCEHTIKGLFDTEQDYSYVRACS